MSILLFMFFIVLIAVFFKLLVFGIKAAWSISKLILCVFFWPIVLVVLVLSGLVYVAFPILVIIGIFSLFKHKK